MILEHHLLTGPKHNIAVPAAFKERPILFHNSPLSWKGVEVNGRLFRWLQTYLDFIKMGMEEI
jgi:hypothetical protein